MGSGNGLAGSGGGMSTMIAEPELTRWLGSRIVSPSSVTAPASINALSRDRDNAATWRARRRSSRPPASCAATRTDVGVDRVSVMNNMSGDPRRNLSGSAGGAESETAQLVARARTMMIISALTTVLAIAAVVVVIGYRIFAFGAPTLSDGTIALPKGARVIAMSASAGRVAVLFDVDGASELRTFDIKTLKETGSLRFTTAP